jgi:hypothetical protein
MQISPFGVASDSYLGDQAAEHIGRTVRVLPEVLHQSA